MPFSGNSYTPPAGSESAAPGQVLQSTVWDAIFTDLAAALTQVAQQMQPTPTTINGVGTSQAGAAAIGSLNFYVRANAQSAQYAYVMTASVSAGNEYHVFNSGAVTAVVWPPTGGQFNVAGGATATGTSIAAGKGLLLMTVTATTFDAMLSL